jgi:hypothetical protein
MNENPSFIPVAEVARPGEIWVPISPRFLLPLRIIGAVWICIFIYLACTEYDRPFSGFRTHWGVWAGQLLLPVWLITIRPALRQRSLWSRIVITAHWFLMVVVALICLRLLLHLVGLFMWVVRH